MLPGFRAAKRPVAAPRDSCTLAEIYGDELPPEVEPGALEVGIFELDGLPVHIARFAYPSTAASPAGEYYQVWGAPIVEEVVMNEFRQPITETVLFREAATAYDRAAITRIRGKLGTVPALDDALRAEIARLADRIMARASRYVAVPRLRAGAGTLAHVTSKLS